ncbi:hypothetical protein D3C78_1466730 [compost metagenome]
MSINNSSSSSGVVNLIDVRRSRANEDDNDKHSSGVLPATTYKLPIVIQHIRIFMMNTIRQPLPFIEIPQCYRMCRIHTTTSKLCSSCYLKDPRYFANRCELQTDPPFLQFEV